MALQFAFDPSKGETPDSAKEKRQEATALIARALGSAPKNVGEGLSAIGQALIARQMKNEADAATAAGQKSAADAWGQILGGAGSAFGGMAPVTVSSAAEMPQGQAINDRVSQAFSGDQKKFVSGLTPAAIKASAATGVDPRIIVAQAALESGYGKHAPGNNLFGIKGPGNTMATTEVVNGQPVKTMASFRGYDSPEASVQGYADFINSNPRYAAFKAADSLDGQIAALGQSGYATDPAYAQKVASIAHSLPPMADTPMPAHPVTPTPGQGAVPGQGYAQTLNGQMAPASAMQQVSVPQGPRIDPAAVEAIPANSPVAPTPVEKLPPPAIVAAPPATPAQPTEMQALAQRFGGSQQLANADPNSGIVAALLGRSNAAPQGQFPAAPAQGNPAQGGASMQPLMTAMSNPWLSDSQKTVAAAILKQKLAQNDPLSRMKLQEEQLKINQLQNPEYGFTTAPDGTVLRTDKRGGTAEPIYKAGPTYRQLSPEEAKTMGLPEGGAYQQKADGQITRIGGSGVNIQVGANGAALGDLPTVPLDDSGKPSPEAQAAFLQKLDPATAALVKGIADYRIPIEKVTSMRGNERQQLAQVISQYDPTFDMSQYATRAAMRKSITSGNYSQALNSANLVIQHLDALSKATDALDNTSFTPWNYVRNKERDATGDPAISQFNTAADAASAELAKVFKGTGVSSESEIKAWRHNLSVNASPAQIKQTIATAVGDLLKSRIDTIRTQYKAAMGHPADFTFLTPHSRQVLSDLGIDPSTIDPNAQQGVPETAPTAPSADGWKEIAPGVRIRKVD